MIPFDIYNHFFSNDRDIRSFFYDIFEKKIEMYCDGYFDESIGMFKEIDCKLVIEKWEDDYSIPLYIEGKGNKKQDFDKYMGIYFNINGIYPKGDFVEFSIGLISNDIVIYGFEKPTIYIEELGTVKRLVPPLTGKEY